MATIDTLYQKYRNESLSTRGLIQVADSRPRLQGNLIIELALMRALGSWEVLLEESFIAYLLGKQSRSGRAYVSVIHSRVTEDRARTALLGERDFLDWLGVQTVGERGERWFPSDYGFLTQAFAMAPDLADMRTVRNRVAHDSGDAKVKFQKLRTRHITSADKRRGMGPGQFLRSPSSYLRTTTPCTRFERYLRELDDAADTITA